MSPDIEMCETCRAAPWKPSTLSAAGSPANLFRRQENGKRKPMTGGCGPNTPAWWMRYDPDTSSWKTCQGYGQPEMQVPKLSLTLPRSATTYGGIVYLLPPSELHTSENESSLWPTPVANDDNKTPEAHMAMKARMPGGPRHKPTSLQVMVKGIEKGMWPTPTSNDGMGGPGRHGREGGANLRTAVDETTGDPTQPKALNPAWVEWLMGFPTGWTDSEPSATP